MLWSKVLWAIEDAYAGGYVLSGLVADLAKAFNRLPRTVVAETSAILGIPFKVLRAWSGALVTMGRAFQLRSFVGDLIFGSTGFPEGDALSCLAMVGVNALMDAWLTAQTQLACPLSYVDDWQVLTTAPDQLDRIITALFDFAQLLDLDIDSRKTYTWSTSAAARRHLRAHEHTVQLSGRNLGAHLQLSRKHTNHVLVSRIKSAAGLWPKLRHSQSPYCLKVRALRQAAWPRCLHGISATTASGQVFRDLRSAAVLSLGVKGAGVNPAVHLGMVEHPLIDPLYWSIIQTLRDARSMGPHAKIRANLRLVARGAFKGPANAVTCALVGRIRKLKWDITDDGRCRDAFGAIDFLSIGMAELSLRSEAAWPSVVAEMTHHREGFSGLEHVDAPHTRKCLKALSVSSQGAYRKLLNGAHITQDCIQHCDVDSILMCAIGVCVPTLATIGSGFVKDSLTCANPSHRMLPNLYPHCPRLSPAMDGAWSPILVVLGFVRWMPSLPRVWTSFVTWNGMTPCFISLPMALVLIQPVPTSVLPVGPWVLLLSMLWLTLCGHMRDHCRVCCKAPFVLNPMPFWLPCNLRCCGRSSFICGVTVPQLFTCFLMSWVVVRLPLVTRTVTFGKPFQIVSAALAPRMFRSPRSLPMSMVRVLMALWLVGVPTIMLVQTMLLHR